MGNEYGRRKGRPNADLLPRFWPTSIFKTKLNAVKSELDCGMHEPIPEQGKWLQAVVRGHIRYYGVPRNQNALWIFRFQVGRLCHRAVSGPSPQCRVLWYGMRRHITRGLP